MKTVRNLVDEIEANTKIEIGTGFGELVESVKNGLLPFYGVIIHLANLLSR